MDDSRNTRVLVVDDEPAIAESLSEFLQDFGFDVVSVGSAEAAIETLDENKFQVAIVDLRLPSMSGEVLIGKVHEVAPSTRFIIHTGSVSFSLSEELEGIGVRPEHVFLKPQSDLNRFVTTIEELLNE